MGLKTNIEMQNTQKLSEWTKEFLESMILFLNSIYWSFCVFFCQLKALIWNLRCSRI